LAANRIANKKKGGSMMHTGKPHEEQTDTNTRFYVLVAKADGGQDKNGFGLQPDELEEIDQVMHMVADIDDEPPQFMTST
jgi:hypothetical protein